MSNIVSPSVRFDDWLCKLKCSGTNVFPRGSFSRRVALAYWLSLASPSCLCAHCTGCDNVTARGEREILLIDVPWKSLPCPVVYRKELF